MSFKATPMNAAVVNFNLALGQKRSEAVLQRRTLPDTAAASKAVSTRQGKAHCTWSQRRSLGAKSPCRYRVSGKRAESSARRQVKLVQCWGHSAPAGRKRSVDYRLILSEFSELSMSSFTQCVARTAIPDLLPYRRPAVFEAFADDDARRAILELRESIKTLPD